ncbi:hypothetical protein [Myroides odoratimimus]|uniref:hypothetical protein n=1 Tax=Myroides odoratimimus TaxID=76832 RepID=UPI0025776DAB|nr:hypothetical protein [Myroides odoratimimus]
MAESFSKNDELTNEEISEKIKNLLKDIVLINQDKDFNKFFTNYVDLYPQLFYDRYTMEEFICTPIKLKEEGIDRDVINAVQKILEKSRETKITSKEVIDNLLDWNDNENCHGIIGFNNIPEVEDHLQIIYGIEGWYKFRRYFLSLYPKDAIFFINECKKYFPNLFFHERNKDTIGVILHNCTKRLIYHLTALNDKFRKSQGNDRNRTEVLEHFSVSNNLDTTASLEGNAERKPSLTFEFYNSNATLESICCEPHLKLCYNDGYPGDSSYSNERRVYFHEGKANISFGKILIGHIGSHL